MMNKADLIKKIVLIALALLIAVELTYYFYIEGGVPIVNNFFSLRWVNKPRLSNDNVMEYFKKEKDRIFFTDLMSYFKPEEKCIFTNNCFEKQSNNLFITYVNPSSFTLSPLSQFYVIRLDMKVPYNGNSVVALLGRLSKYPTELYWENILGMLFGTTDNNHYLSAYALPGDKDDHISLVEESINQRATWYLIFDRKGKNFIIFDKYFDVVRKIDINELSGGRISNGLFPESKIYFGYLLAPESYMMITNFSIAPL